MAATISDIAREAGVSIATVSRVINGTKEVSPELKQRVYEVVERLDFAPNQMARGLVTRRSGMIGLILSDISNNVFSMLTKGIESVCQEQDYTLIVCESGGKPENEIRLLKKLGERQIDGVLFAGVNVNAELVAAIQAQAYPTVLVTQEEASGEVTLPTVVHNNLDAMRDAIQFLLDNGHRRIAFISGPEDDFSSGRKRLLGYQDKLTEQGIEYNEAYVAYGAFTFESGYRAMKKIYEENPQLPTAVMACDDVMAVGAMRFLEDMQLRVPEQMSVMGFDDTALTTYVNPELSTVRIPYHEEGAAAARALFSLMRGEKRPRKGWPVFVPHQIIRRKSVRNVG